MPALWRDEHAGCEADAGSATGRQGVLHCVRDGLSAAMTDDERFTALLALHHSPLYCQITNCLQCRAYYRILLMKTT